MSKEKYQAALSADGVVKEDRIELLNVPFLFAYK
jgi:hypothetical protein